MAAATPGTVSTGATELDPAAVPVTPGTDPAVAPTTETAPVAPTATAPVDPDTTTGGGSGESSGVLGGTVDTVDEATGGRTRAQ